MKEHAVANVGEIAPGTWKITTVNGREIGIYNRQGVYYAVRNVCPHAQAELCKGTVSGTNMPSEPHEYIYGMEEEVIICPWHGWEFDLKTGYSLVDPERYRVKTYEVTVKDDKVVVLV